MKNLTRAQIAQLQAYVDHCGQEGWYYGTKAHFEQRHKAIVEWVADLTPRDLVTKNPDRPKDKEAHREYMRKRARERRALAKKMREAGEKLDAQPVPTKGRKLV